jgi:hypothetical protein
VHAALRVEGLCLLVQYPAVLWDAESDDSRTARDDRLTLAQARDRLSPVVPPRPPKILAIGVVKVVVVFWPIRPRLDGDVLARVVDVVAIRPGRVERASMEG